MIQRRSSSGMDAKRKSSSDICNVGVGVCFFHERSTHPAAPIQAREQQGLHSQKPGKGREAEVEAGEVGLSYVKLDGNVGCMVNGAGFAMATMDMIKIAGQEPANFLDVGGTADAKRV